MADYSQGGPPPPPPMMLHSGRIPSFKNNHGENFQNRCGAEPPACVQNAMMTKDKKPFTYTPGGLDLSQIRTPSMARRLNRQQQQQEDSENPAYFQKPSYNGGGPPPPPPPPMAPPPPPPLVISINKPNKPIEDGVRPEIVIPENPIGMLRKTHSPYHWESEQSDRESQGHVPKFVGNSPTPNQMRQPPPRMPPQQFSPQPAQPFSPAPQSPYSPQVNKSASTSPIWKPEPKYPNSPQQYSNNTSPQVQSPHTPQSAQTPTKNMLQRQDSQFNHSPSPWGKESPFPSENGMPVSSPAIESQISPKSATPVSSSASPWRQVSSNNSPMAQDMRNSPLQSPNNIQYRNSPMEAQRSPTQPMSPLAHSQSMRSPNSSPYVEPQRSPQAMYNNVAHPEEYQQNAAPWRQQAHQPMSPVQQVRGSPQQSPSQNYVQSPSPLRQNSEQFCPDGIDPEVRYQTHMTIPVTPRKQKPGSEPQTPGQSQEPVFPVLLNNTKDNLPWARNNNIVNKSTPPPPWCQRSAEGRKSMPREMSFEQPETPGSAQPQGRPFDNRQSLPRDNQAQESPQPPWVQNNRGSETLPRGHKMPPSPCMPEQIIQHVDANEPPGRVIPMQIEAREVRVNSGPGQNQMRMNQQGAHNRGQQQPQLRIIIDMNKQGQPGQQGLPPAGPNQTPQHVMRIVQPHLVRVDSNSHSPAAQEQYQQPQNQPQQPQTPHQPRTRIIPIQMEPSSPVATTPRVIVHKINFDGPPRQSRAFRVLQTITGTDESDDIQDMEQNHGFSDL